MFGRLKYSSYLCNRKRETITSVTYVANGFSTDRQNKQTLKYYVVSAGCGTNLKAVYVCCNLSLSGNYTFLVQLKRYTYIRSLTY